MEENKRKIIKVPEERCKQYQILKPRDSGENGNLWYKYGQKKSLKGIIDFLLTNEACKLFNIEVSGEIMGEIEEYRIKQTKKSKQYLAKGNSLESKTI